MRKAVIFSYCETQDRRIDLSGKNPVVARRLADLYRWSRVEYDQALWEEFAFLANLLEVPATEFSIWQMPLYSGIHLDNAFRSRLGEGKSLLINNLNQHNKDEVFRLVREFNPSHAFVSTTFYLSLSELLKVLSMIRNNLPGVRIVLGGNFIFKELLLRGNDADFLAKLGPDITIVNSRFGEQESVALLEDLASLDNRNLIRAPEGSAPIFGPHSDKEYDINGWPIRHCNYGFDYRMMPVRTSSGCSFNCNFCSYPAVGGHYKAKDVSTIIAELKQYAACGVKQLVFLDDTLNFPVDRFKRILRAMIAEGLTDFSCYSFCRCQYLDEEAAQLMVRCGFKAVLLGIESGSDKILTNMNKRTTVDKYLSGLELLRKHGILSFGAIIIGFPGETLETVSETVRFLQRGLLDFCYVQPFYYLHNSPIHGQREQYALKGEGLMWRHDTMDSTKCMEVLRDIFLQVDKVVYANEEYAMWELVYFHYKGFSSESYRSYRQAINSLRRIGLEQNVPEVRTRLQNQLLAALKVDLQVV